MGTVSRTPDVVRAVAAHLGIAHAETDWAGALQELSPDIVAIGTPGGVQVGQALERAEGPVEAIAIIRSQYRRGPRAAGHFVPVEPVLQPR